MIYKKFALNEIDILRNLIKVRIEEIENGEEDADTIGTEKVYSEKMLKLLDVVESTCVNFNDIGVVHQDDARYVLGVLNDIYNGIPLSELNSYEEKPDEWTECVDMDTNRVYLYYNKRYPQLTRNPINIENHDGPEFIYSNIDRFTFYDLIKNRKVSLFDLAFGVKKAIPQIHLYLNRLCPISFPYDIKQDRLKVYVEIFECPLQDNADPVKTLAITHIMPKGDDKPTRIMAFFDISEDGIKEIDIKSYLPRRQIFEKSIEMSIETDREVPDEEQ